MFAAGLVSVSFREERPESILREASAAGLSGICLLYTSKSLVSADSTTAANLLL